MQSKPRFKLGLDGSMTPIKPPPRAPKPISQLRRTIGERLSEERYRFLLTQTQIAEALGVSRRSVVSWEQGTSTPNAEQLACLMTLKLDAAYVVTGRRSACTAQA